MTIPMLLILGCTASGKGKLAFSLAQRMGGHILSIDSMKVYRRMDIGTAKPDRTALSEIPHYLIDVVEPWDAFSMGRFIDLADKQIDGLAAQNIPIIAVGGTAMYIRGLLEGIFDGPPASEEIRRQLKDQADQTGLESLYQRLLQIDPEACIKIHANDQKRIIRALEVYELTGRPISSFHTQFGSGHYRHPWRIIGLRRDKEDASRRINGRVRRMIELGLVDEVKSLLADPRGLSDTASQAVGYAEIIEHLNGKLSLDEAVERIKINTRQLAKNQRTWFRRFNDVMWFDIGENDTADGVAQRVLEAI